MLVNIYVMKKYKCIFGYLLGLTLVIKTSIISLGVQMMISGVVTQGRAGGAAQWTKSYVISYSINGAQFKNYRELTTVNKVNFSPLLFNSIK